jgi:accessory Sec system S-layer assembly protein
MLTFFKKLFAGKSRDNLNELRQDIQEDAVVEGEDIESLGIAAKAEESPSTDRGVYTNLSLHESWEKDLKNEQRYVLSFMQTSLPPLKEGQVAITGFNFHITEEGLVAFGFIRNGLNRPIRFENIPLLFLGEEDVLVARKEFDLSEAGEIPPHSDRPWSFLFEDHVVTGKEVSLRKWKLAFEIRRQPQYVPVTLDMDEAWREQIAEEAVRQLEAKLQSLPSLQPGEFNISGIEAKKMENGDINVLVFLRNGTNQSLNVNQIPLVLMDAEGEEVASGLFKTENLEVRPGTAKPWRFIFPAGLIVKPEADLSRWSIQMPQSESHK